MDGKKLERSTKVLKRVIFKGFDITLTDEVFSVFGDSGFNPPSADKLPIREFHTNSVADLPWGLSGSDSA
jgi:hypothetical protein